MWLWWFRCFVLFSECCFCWFSWMAQSVARVVYFFISFSLPLSFSVHSIEIRREWSVVFCFTATLNFNLKRKNNSCSSGYCLSNIWRFQNACKHIQNRREKQKLDTILLLSAYQFSISSIVEQDPKKWQIITTEWKIWIKIRRKTQSL